MLILYLFNISICQSVILQENNTCSNLKNQHNLQSNQDLYTASDYFTLFNQYFFGDPDSFIPRNYTKSYEYLQKSIELGNTQALFANLIIFRETFLTTEFSEIESIVSANPINTSFISSLTKSHNLLAISHFASLLNCLNPQNSYNSIKSPNHSVPLNTFPFQLITNCTLSKSLTSAAVLQASKAKKIIDKAGISKRIVSILAEDPSSSYGPEQEKLLILKSKLFQYKADISELVKLGNIFYFGSNLLGIDTDHNLALKYYKKAVKLGSKVAAAKIGKMYLKGQGVSKNITKAVKYLNIAANKDSLDAIKSLTILYEKGVEVEQNLTLAFELAQKGVDLGDTQSYNNLGVYYINGIGVDKNKLEGVKYIAAAAVLGSPVAMYNMALFYYEGKVIIQDLVKSLNLSLSVIHAAQQDDYINLGYKYYKEGNYKTSYLYYLFAAGLGYKEAYKALSYFWINGLVDSKCKVSESWCLEYYLRLGMSKGDDWSFIQLGKLLMHIKDEESAKKVFELSDDNGEKLYFLGYMAENGIGGTRNYTQALEYYKKMIILASSDEIDPYSKYPGLISLYTLKFKILLSTLGLYF